MNLQDFNIEQNELNESVFSPNKVSDRAKKLEKKLDKKIKKLEKENKRKDLSEEKREKNKEIIETIKKAQPIVEKFTKYFERMEKRIANEPFDKQRKLIKAKYDEVRVLFIKELYNILYYAGENSAAIISSLIANLILVTVFIPGGFPILVSPTFMLIRNIKQSKEKIQDGKLRKEMEKLIKELERIKRRSYKAYEKA